MEKTFLEGPLNEKIPNFQPAPPKQLAEVPHGFRRNQYQAKESVSFVIFKVTMENVQRLQQTLFKFGPIKSLDTRRLNEGMIIVNYFDLKTASNAYCELKEIWKDVHVEYIFNSKVQLASINELEDAGGSDKSEEGSEGERRARESLENTKQKLKEEYEKSDDSSSDTPPTKKMELSPAPTYSAHNNDPHGSDTSFDNNDMPNEGIKVNFTTQFEPRLLPKAYTTPGTILQTESTNMDPEDSWCQPSYLDASSFGMYENQYCSQDNLQFLRTQPVRNLVRQQVVHTHTKSYDIDFLRNSYIQNYYKWCQPENYYTAQMYDAFSFQSLPETQERYMQEEAKVSFNICLRDILEKKDSRTTLMIRNIPNKYTQKMLLQKIDINHYMKYDFFYLPIDPNNNCNVGYGFINFINPLYIPRFYEDMNAKRWEKFNSEKICQLAYARIQGLKGLLEHFQCTGPTSQHVK